MPPRLPRDVSGEDFVRLLRPYGFRPVRQHGSHIRLTAVIDGVERHVTVPRHSGLRVGTLSSIVQQVAGYLGVERDALIDELFG